MAVYDEYSRWAEFADYVRKTGTPPMEDRPPEEKLPEEPDAS